MLNAIYNFNICYIPIYFIIILCRISHGFDLRGTYNICSIFIHNTVKLPAGYCNIIKLDERMQIIMEVFFCNCRCRKILIKYINQNNIVKWRMSVVYLFLFFLKKITSKYRKNSIVFLYLQFLFKYLLARVPALIWSNVCTNFNNQCVCVSN